MGGLGGGLGTARPWLEPLFIFVRMRISVLQAIRVNVVLNVDPTPT